jgi:hypothetical protein
VRSAKGATSHETIRIRDLERRSARRQGVGLDREPRAAKPSVHALKDKKIGGAAIDVFDQEPLLLDHPFRSLPNLLATPQIGYVSRGLYDRFYQDTVANIARWLDGQVAGWRALRPWERRS